MRTATFLILALAALVRAQSKPVADELYVRPLDDCVRMAPGAAAPGSLFPDQFRVAGSPVETGEPFVTEVRGRVKPPSPLGAARAARRALRAARRQPQPAAADLARSPPATSPRLASPHPPI
jgi:hypothetical protein